MADIIVLNEITELLNNVNSGLSTSISNVKSTVDTISTNVNTANTNINTIKTNTAATTTENSSGTLSAKLTYLINRRDRICVVSNTTIATLTTSLKTDTTQYGKDGDQLAYSSYTSNKIVCYLGNIRISCTATITVQKLHSTHQNTSQASNVCYLEVYVNNNLYTTKEITSIMQYNCTSGQTTDAKTITIDVPVSAGNIVKCRLKVVSNGGYITCYGNNYSDGIYATASNISICASTEEKTSLVI